MSRITDLLRSTLFCAAILLFAVGGSAWAESVSREAEKHMNRGMAAVEMANSPSEHEEAIREFEQAVSLAPDWSAPYFNLGYVQNEIGKYQKALNSYRKYLELVPNASDAAQVRTEIDQIEYRLEKILKARHEEERLKEKYIAVLGVWEENRESYRRNAFGVVTREVRLINGQLMVSSWDEYMKHRYTKQELARNIAGKDRWVLAEFDGTILTFHYGKADNTSDFRATHGYDSYREENYTVKFPSYGTSEGYYVVRYTDPGYAGFGDSGRVQKWRSIWTKASEKAINYWRSIPE